GGKVPPFDTRSHRNRQCGDQRLHVTGAQRHGVLPPVVNGLPKCPNHLAGVKRVRLHFTSLSVLASLTSVCQILPGLSTRSEKKVREVGSPSSDCGNVSQCPTDDTLVSLSCQAVFFDVDPPTDSRHVGRNRRFIRVHHVLRTAE